MIVDQSVGEAFDEELLVAARDKTLAVVNEVLGLLAPGVSETDVRGQLDSIALKYGIEKRWHPPQVRFGENTVLPFGVPGKGSGVLREDDIAFVDLGLIYKGHEGDVGRVLVLGNDPEKNRCAKDVEVIWQEVRDHWKSTGVKGAELYAFARESAGQRGWDLCLKKANGHRISDFPHAARSRGSIQGFSDEALRPNRWILEIQIIHPSGEFGAFYEDLLA